MIHLLGTLGSFLLIFSAVPQLYTTITTKTTKGLSLWMLISMNLGCIIMLIYILTQTIIIPILVNYVFNILFSTANIYYYYKYRNS
jgi:uncharacterized protein with PQ loop repeat